MRILWVAMFVLAGCIPAGDSQEFGSAKLDAGQDTSEQRDATFDQDTTTDLNSDDGAQADLIDMDEPDESSADMCEPPDDPQLCEANAVECGAARVPNPCGGHRDVGCGDCGNGQGCSSGKCIEAYCRDNNDNDGDGKSDCQDEDCLGQFCTNENSQRRCTENGQCQ